MRLVSNKTNAKPLIDLNANFVRPLLVALANAASVKKPLAKTHSFRNASPETQAAIVAAMPVKADKTSLESLCRQILRRHSASELLQTVSLYDTQCSQLASGNYCIKPDGVPSGIARLFSKYIYEQLFDHEALWHALLIPRMTRERFHENFRLDNNYPSSCPYCDLDTINSQGNYIIEHFLPRARFPLLSVHPCNLFTACNSCNLAAEGKGARVVGNVTTPYVNEIGSLVTFDFDNATMRVAIEHAAGRSDVDGFLDLLQLRERYGKKNTWRQMRGRIEAFVESVTGRNLTAVETLEYARRFNRGGVLNYALLSWVSQAYP